MTEATFGICISTRYPACYSVGFATLYPSYGILKDQACAIGAN